MTLEEQPESFGLEWIQTTFSTEPRWTTEIDLESIQRTIKESEAIKKSKSINATKTVQVSFLAQGGFNKLYTVRIDDDDETFIMRVSLPVDPYWKTSSEVATIEWMHCHTTLPVPKIFTYQTSRNNAIGFEWILMTKIPGKPLADAWKSIDWNAKKQLVQQLAIHLSILFKKQLRGIGNIYSNDESDDRASFNELPTVKRIVSMEFFWGGRRLQNVVPRGPFRSSKDWIDARLLLNEHDCKFILSNSQDEDDLEDAERTFAIIERLRICLDEIFPDEGISEPEPTVFCHDDLSKHNIMVDDNGRLTGVVDWECVSALPLWKACDYPAFLQSRFRDIKPDQKLYEGDDSGESLYWEHLMEYELTILRRHFIDEMRKLEQEWITIFESNQLQRDFDTAVQYCNSEFSARQINEWLDDIASGKKLVSLQDRFYG